MSDPVQESAGRLYDEGKAFHEEGQRLYKEKQYEAAFDLYLKAADHGYNLALTSLIDCYISGTGVARDYGKAVECANIGVECGFWNAYIILGILYELGVGVEKDKEKANALIQEGTSSDKGAVGFEKEAKKFYKQMRRLIKVRLFEAKLGS